LPCLIRTFCLHVPSLPIPAKPSDFVFDFAVQTTLEMKVNDLRVSYGPSVLTAVSTLLGAAFSSSAQQPPGLTLKNENATFILSGVPKAPISPMEGTRT